MQWFSGDIGSAINLAKTNNAVFVVYCEGKDENSANLTNYINSEAVSARLQSKSFVAVRIESDKPDYIQFCKIYQIVPVPSLFFIKNGIPIKIVTSAAKSSDEIAEAIDAIIQNENSSSSVKDEVTVTKTETVSNQAAPSTSQPSETEVKSSPEIVCEGGVCYKKEPEKLPETSNEQEATVNEETEAEKQEKVRRAMKLIEEKRIEKIKEEERLEKEREIRRRKEGQEVQQLKKWQDEQELQQLKDERKKEKMEAMEARRRVLEQIEEDKKERARRFNTSATTPPETKEPEKPLQEPTTPTSDSAKIQFKKPDGECEIVTFDVTMLFGDLYSFVKSDILQGYNIKDFTLATVFPRREFASDDFGKTLLELNLCPTSVLLIIPGKKTSNNFAQNRGSVLPTHTGGSFFDMISALIMGLISPIFALFAYMKSFVFKNEINDSEAGKRKRDEESLVANDAAKKRNMNAYNPPEASTSSAQTGAIPKSATYKRVNPSSNIHRLQQDSDSEDERKTYNGNSTQQM